MYKLLINYAHIALLGCVKRPISLCGNIPAQKLMYVDVPIMKLHLSCIYKLKGDSEFFKIHILFTFCGPITENVYNVCQCLDEIISIQ